MRVLIAGGGTGGHLFPGVAVAEEIAARGTGARSNEVLFVGTARGIEVRVLPRDGWRLELIDVGGLKGGGALGIARGLLRILRALLQSWRILRRFRPDLVVGVGGYASGPVLLVAALTGRPTAVLEQNSIPGFTNRVLGRLVRAVFASFDESARFFPRRTFQLVGNPIRTRVRAALAAPDGAARNDATATSMGGKKTLLVVGGSQGAHAVNGLVTGAMERLAAEARAPRIVHQTGAADRAAVEERYRSAGIDADVREFIDDMAAAYRAADLVVCRAGATTIAELTAIGRPAIFIPLPTAADDHQTINARVLERAGAAKSLPQSGLTPEQLAAAIGALLDDDPGRERMAAAARALGRPDAAARIVDRLAQLAPP